MLGLAMGIRRPCHTLGNPMDDSQEEVQSFLHERASLVVYRCAQFARQRLASCS